METALGVLLPNAAISRIAGANRYETNAMFSAATFPIEGWASIPAAAFGAFHPATDIAQIGSQSYNTTTGILGAPIQLPHGAEILELRAGVYDADSGASIDVKLYQVTNPGGAVEAALASSGVGFNTGFTTLSDTTIAAGTEIVDNETYAYMVSVTGADGNPFIGSVKVRYRLGVSTG